MNTTTPESDLREKVLREIIKELMTVVSLGIDMRRCQRRFFRSDPGSPEREQAKQDSIAAERTFDLAAAKAIAPSLDLGGGHASGR